MFQSLYFCTSKASKVRHLASRRHSVTLTPPHLHELVLEHLSRFLEVVDLMFRTFCAKSPASDVAGRAAAAAHLTSSRDEYTRRRQRGGGAGRIQL
jgi:hypothetical protein